MRRAHLAMLPIVAFGLAACAGGPAVGSGAPTSSTPTVSETETRVTELSTTAPAPTALPLCTGQAMHTGPGAGSTNNGAFVVTTAVYNKGDHPCVIDGYPQVALTGLPPATGDWPRKQLTVSKVGASSPVTLTPGDGAVVTLTFGACKAGQEPFHAPVALLGVGGQQIQLGLEDGGDFVECGDVVQTTAFEAHQP